MKRKIVRVALSVAAAVACFSIADVRSGAQRVTDPKTATDVTKERPDHVPGRVLVKFRKGTSGDSVDGVMRMTGLRSSAVISNIGVHLMNIPETGRDEDYVQILRGSPDVEFAELDKIVSPSEIIPNDALYGEEWHLTKISAPAAWSSSTGSSSVIIAILDTGVDATHEDLADKIVPGWNIYSNNSNTSDVYGHGTKVAGVAAASSNNVNGVASVAWGCKIMPIRISDASGNATYSSMASGLTWAADHGAKVANISYIASTSSAVKSAAQYFQSKGGVVVSSAGNYTTFDPSADNPYILTVSATDQWDVVSYFSNTGNNVDLAAPEGADTTQMGGGYTYAGGTSIASPIVAGVAALVLSANPGLTGAQAQDIVKSSADDLGPSGWDPSYGWGRVNADKAVRAATGNTDAVAPSVSFSSPSSGSTVTGVTQVQIAATDNVSVTSVDLSVDGQSVRVLSSGPYSFQWNTASVNDGAHQLVATARDGSGNVSSATVSVSVTNYVPPADTVSPSITITSPKDGDRLATNAQVNVAASDNVRVAKVELYMDGKMIGSSATAPFSIRMNTKKIAAGTHTLQCRAYDSAGNIGTSPSLTVYK
jgi:thermitase